MRAEERPRGVIRKVADTTGLDFSSLLEDVDSDPSGIVGAKWIFPPGLYQEEPETYARYRALQSVGVSPKDWSDHLRYSESKDLPWSAPSEQRYNVAYDKTADIMDRTSVVDDLKPVDSYWQIDSPTLSRVDPLRSLAPHIEKAWDVSKLLGGALTNQAKEGWKNIKHVGQKTQDNIEPNWARFLDNSNPNWVDLQANVRAVMDKAYNTTSSDRGITDTSVWNPGQISVNDIDTRIQSKAPEPTGGYVNQIKSFLSKALEGLRGDPIESDASAIQGAAGISTTDLLRRALTDQGLKQDARKINPLGGGGLLSSALTKILGRGLGAASYVVPSPMDGRRYADRKGRVVTPDGSKVTLTDELLDQTVGRGSVPTGTADRLKENRLSMIPFAINPATDRYEYRSPPYFNEVVSGQPGPAGPVDDSNARQAREAEQYDSSNAIQSREAEARAQRKKENKVKTEKVKTATTKALESVIKRSSFGGGLSKKQKKEVAKVVTSSKNISNATAAARGDVKSAITIALTSGDVQRAWAKSKGIDPSTVYGSTLRRTEGGGWAGGF